MRTCDKNADTKPTLQHPTTTIALSNNPQCIDKLKRDSTELHLIKLLQQHRYTTGWIVIVAPEIKPNKAFWSACQLPLDKILIVHQRQIKDLKRVLQQAICTKSCKVIVNCAPLNHTDLTWLTAQALQQHSRFYTLDSALSAAH